LIAWLGIATSKFHDWQQRYGKVNEHNAMIPRDHWLTPAERQAIVDFHAQYPLEGYRRLTFMMLDRNVVACAPASVYRVLKANGLIGGRKGKLSQKGLGFQQPTRPHEHWHIDVSYLNIAGTFYYLCSVIDGYSRAIVHWELRESMTSDHVQLVLQKAIECHPDVTPRVVSDNGPQFLARDFKDYIRITGMTHVRTSPYYPQSNGKIERWHGTMKQECIRPKTPLNVDDARRALKSWIQHYNDVRLHSAIGYITPADKLAGKEKQIFAARDRKLAEARERRRKSRLDHNGVGANVSDVPANDHPEVATADTPATTTTT
jgi:transposase InsO family protein